MALYDPKEFPEVEVEQDLAQRFLEFCRSKGDAEYDYWGCVETNRCAILQFLAADNNTTPYWEVDRRLRMAAVAKPRTFGALADRLEQALAEQVAVS